MGDFVFVSYKLRLDSAYHVHAVYVDQRILIEVWLLINGMNDMNLIIQNLTRSPLTLQNLVEQYGDSAKVPLIVLKPFVNNYVVVDDHSMFEDIIERMDGRCGSFIVKRNNWKNLCEVE